MRGSRELRNKTGEKIPPLKKGVRGFKTLVMLKRS